LGIFAGFGGPEHGYFEILQGNVRPDSLWIAAMGPPCNPEEVWNLCEPAMTVVPNFLITGILASILGVVAMIWAARFVHRKNGPLVLALLCVGLLLFGGGLTPPVFGLVGAALATRINAPLKEQPVGRVAHFLAGLWPWSLVAFFTLLLGQFVIGHFFNDFLIESGFFLPGLILGLMVLAIASGFAHDREVRGEK
jgi:MFS family permease